MGSMNGIPNAEKEAPLLAKASSQNEQSITDLLKPSGITNLIIDAFFS